MRALYATLRHPPAPLAGIFVALTMTAMFLTWAITLGGAASATIVPAQRLASAAIVVQGNPTVQEISGSGPSASVDSKPLTSYREVPASLITRLAALPGVRAAVADQSAPVALSSPATGVVLAAASSAQLHLARRSPIPLLDLLWLTSCSRGHRRFRWERRFFSSGHREGQISPGVRLVRWHLCSPGRFPS